MMLAKIVCFKAVAFILSDYGLGRIMYGRKSFAGHTLGCDESGAVDEKFTMIFEIFVRLGVPQCGKATIARV